jgi:hypothetical protein
MLRYVLACALALASPLAFAGKPPTDAQIDRLLEITHARTMVDGVLGQMETMQKQMFKQVLEGREPTPEEQAQIDRIGAISLRTVRETLTWDRLVPMYHRIYAESLDADDIDAMIAFYETPAGQHVIERMPVILQKSMGEMQQLLVPALKQMQEDIAAEVAKMKAEERAAK